MKSYASLLLRRNISAGQIAGYAVSNIIGLTIIMAALIFYGDIKKSINGGEDSVRDTSYLVLSHPVGVFGGKSAPFTEVETDSLKAQPWVDDAATFVSATFSVDAYIGIGGGELGTAFFIEGVPDRFIDNIPAGFTFNPGDRTIPLILPRDYLSLYNYGFASSRNFPALSEEMAGSIPLRIAVRGERGSEVFPARIAGFSNRINSILAPESFMDYANAEFGSGEDEAERIIVRIGSPGNPEIEKYIESHNLESSADSGESRRLTFFLEILTGTVVSIGGIITLLSLFILILSLSLIIQKSKNEIRGLLMLGYSIRQVSATFIRIVLCVNLTSLITATAAASALSGLWRGPLLQLGIEPAGIMQSVLPAGIATVLLLTIYSVFSIRQKVSRSF